MALIALIPAHNEAANISAAIASLRQQAVTFDRVLVVADNCTDDTAALAISSGAEVFTTSGNIHRKAGALNQALAALPLNDDDHVLVLDADSRLGDDYMRVVQERFDNPVTGAAIGAVGGIFEGLGARSLIEDLQCAEYARYAREIGRRRGQVFVLTGTASVFRVQALRDIAASRGTLLPGRQGDVYDLSAITEDNEITIALKTLGWRLVSPRECTVHTELMPNHSALHAQRLRWYRGALDNIITYGWTPVTRRYWLQQAGLLISSIMLMLYLVLMTMTVVSGNFSFSWFWTGIGAVFALERVATAWRAGVRARLTAALLVPELVYDFALQLAFFDALGQMMRRRTPEWTHHPVTTR